MSFKVRIRQVAADGGESLAVGEGETVLEAALAAGIDYPHGCQSGNCGSCKSELVSGEIEMSPYSEFALSAAEKAQGLILACRAVPWSDCEVAWVEPGALAVHAHRRLVCRVTGLEDATHDIKIMRLAIESGGPFDFTAGQYAAVTFEGLPPRDYSMANQPGANQPGANQPGETDIEFHIRLAPGGAVTPFVSGVLRLGDRVRVEGPFGNAYLRAGHRGPILALAGGSGLAPVKAIVDAALGHDPDRTIHVYLGFRAERDVYLEDHFRALAAAHPNLRLDVVLSKPDGPGPRRKGFLHEALAADHDDLKDAKLYIAGPPVMVEALLEAAKQRGARRQDCHADAFYSEAEKAVLEAAG